MIYDGEARREQIAEILMSCPDLWHKENALSAADKVLAAAPASPLRGREPKPSAWRACWVSLNTSRTQLFEIEADATAKARETDGCVIPLYASPPEQPAAEDK